MKLAAAPVSSRLAFPVIALLLLLLMLGSLMLGRYPVPLGDVVRILATTPPFGAVGNADDPRWVVVEIVRLPRILETVLVGVALAVAGTALQGVFRNPLVGPEICGVVPGAAFGGVLAIFLGWSSMGIVGSAYGFGFAAVVLAFLLARLAGRGGMLALILAGFIVGSFFAAAMGLIEYMADPQSELPAITYWLLGSLAGASYAKVAIIAFAVLVAGTALMALRWRLNLLSLGETDARTLGIDVAALRWTVIALAAFLVAAQVAVSGGVNFVGLIMPHFARLLVGPEHTKLMPVAALLGGLYLLGMDDIARSAAATEIPIGLLTSFVGAPIFAFLFWRYQGRGWSDE